MKSNSNISMEKNSFTNELLYVDDDNCVDIVYWGNETYVKLGNCDGTFGPNIITTLSEYDFSWDYKNVDLNADGTNELIIFNNDQQNNSAYLNVFLMRNSDDSTNFERINNLPFPSQTSYFDIKKLNEQKFLFTASQLINQETETYFFDQNPIFLLDNSYNIEKINYPFTTPIRNILFDNNEIKLNWETTLLPDDPNPFSTPVSQWSMDNPRARIKEWYVYISDDNFIYPDESGVEKLTFDDTEIEKEDIGNNEIRYKVKLDINFNEFERKYIRVSYKLDNGIFNNLSYSVSINK